ncbi:hypothetical protein HDU98_008598 [Podochytrium sp. JEL0797]|nr:hypothetical protein HDU98_008598 [Podochytrium sp. JEL0797]
MGLAGGIPPILATLTALSSLDMSGNKFVGAVPDIFTNMQALTSINLSGNGGLTGSLPPSLIALPALANIGIAGVTITVPPVLLTTLLKNGGPQAVALALNPNAGINSDCALLTLAFDGYNTSAGTTVNQQLGQSCTAPANNTFITYTLGPVINITLNYTFPSAATTATGVAATSAALASAMSSASGSAVATASGSAVASGSAAATSSGSAVASGSAAATSSGSAVASGSASSSASASVGFLRRRNIKRRLGISGNIPSLIGELSYLQVLDLSGNQFSGQIPTSFNALSMLTTLNIQGNSITGGIPAQLLAIIQANGGSINYGTNCITGNANAICPQAPNPPFDCHALSLDKTFVNPIYTPLWKDSANFDGFAAGLPTSDDPLSPEYYYQQFLAYLKDLKYCQKNAKMYTYWTYARANPGMPKVYGRDERHLIR